MSSIDLLPIFARHSLDALTVHGAHRGAAVSAAGALRPHPAGGRNDAVSGHRQRPCALRGAGAGGVDADRRARPDDRAGVIRSPWLFNQIRQQLRGETVTLPTGRDVAAYIRALWDSQACFDKPERVQCERMKKFLNYLGEGVPAPFLHQIRRTQTAADFHRICEEFLGHDEPMALPPAELMATPG